MKKSLVTLALLAAGLCGCTATVVPTPGTDHTTVIDHKTTEVAPAPASNTNVKVNVPAAPPAAPPATNVKVTTENK